MNVVLYAAQDMEPITVIDLPIERRALAKMYELCPVIHVEVVEEVSMMPPGPNDTGAAATRSPMRAVRCQLVPVYRDSRDVMMWCFITDDEELALALKPAVLPGQRREWQEQFRRGFAAGLVAAIVR